MIPHPDTYQELALRTANGLPDRQDRLDNAVLGLIGELGEISELVKKARFHGHPLDQLKLKSEAGDLLWYVAWLASEYGLKLGDVMARQSFAEFQGRHHESIPCVEGVEKARMAAYICNMADVIGGIAAGYDLFGFREGAALMRTLLICLSRLLYISDIGFGETAEGNIEKLRARYPDGFSQARSLHREG